MGFKKGWKAYKASKTKSKTKAHNPKRKRKYMPRKKNRRNRKFTVPLAVVMPLAATFFSRAKPEYDSPVNSLMKGDFQGFADSMVTGWTPVKSYRGQLTIDWHIPPYFAMVAAGAVVHKIATFLGINRTLAAHKIPFIRI